MKRAAGSRCVKMAEGSEPEGRRAEVREEDLPPSVLLALRCVLLEG